MKLIDRALIDGLVRNAAASARRRSNFNLHPTPADPVQRLLVATKIDTYFRPHRHETKWECALVIQGRFDLFLFDGNGIVTRKIQLGKSGEAMGFEIPAQVWHAWMPVEDDGVFFEVKEGPYDPARGTAFASWAPPEGDAAVPDFLARLRSAKVGGRMAPPFF
jgi:cupin fold WbuC family metalloprotein